MVVGSGFVECRATRGSLRENAALFVPGPASSLIDCFVGEPDEVERVDALTHVRGFLVDRVLEGDAHIEADGLEFRHPLRTELAEEGAKGGGALARLRPDDPALSVVVGDDGQVAMTLSIGDLVDPEATKFFEAVNVEHVTHDVDNDLGDCFPRDPQQLRDGGLGDALGEPRDHRAEGFRVTCPGTRPGHALGANASALRTLDPTDLGFEKALSHPEIEVTPATRRAVG